MSGFDSDRLIGRRFRTYKFVSRFCRQEKLEAERFWGLPTERLRFTVGESFRSLKIPFAIAPVLSQSMTAALEEILVLARMRHAKRIDTAEYDQMVLSDSYGTADLRPLSLAVDPRDNPPLAERTIAAALPIDSFLDAGMLRGWLADEAHGGILLGQLSRAYRKAFLEERSLVRTEPTTYLTQLAVLKHLIPLWRREIKKVKSASFAERVEIAGAVLLHALFDELVHAAFENPVLVDSTQIDVRVEYLLKTSISPLTFMRDPDTVLRAETNPYGFTQDFHAAAVAQWKGKDLLREDLDAEVDLATRELSRDELRVADAVENAWLAEVRRHIVFVVGRDPQTVSELGKELWRIACDTRQLRHSLFSRTVRGQLVAQLEAVDRGAIGSERNETYATLARHIASAESLRKDASRAFGRAVLPESLLREALRAVAVFELDRKAREVVDRAATLLVDKRLDEKTVVIAAEYEAGRLYRIAGDEHPILRLEVAREAGHLFIDLKDFTKKTHSLKEVNMADFLRSEFYGPLLAVARELTNERQADLTLNNLLGDALSFSGDVKVLVEFAERAMEHLGGYRAKLKARVPESVVKGELQRLEKKWAIEKARIAEKRAQLEGILRDLSSKFRGGTQQDRTGTFSVGAGLLGEITRATNALYKLEEREQELEREIASREEYLTGSEMVAGIFISWGAPPMVVNLSDATFGDVKVAIAEKINEAARGTARNPEVKRRLDQRIRDSRNARRAADPMKTEAVRLEYPFRVHIDKFYSLPVPGRLSNEFRRVMEERDLDGAKRMFALLGDEAYSEFAQGVERKTLASLESVVPVHDLYNAGIAMSEEALGAYQRLNKDRYQFFAKSLEIGDLDDSFHARFVFEAPRVRFVFAAVAGSDQPRHVFRHAGSMVFRGFEQRTATGIFELLNPRDAFTRMLVDRHFSAWYKAFRSGKKSAERSLE